MPLPRQTSSVLCGQSYWVRHVTPDCDAQFDVVEPLKNLVPRPYCSLRCLTCAHVLHVLREAERPLLLLWAIEQGEYESFREFVDKGYVGKGGQFGGGAFSRTHRFAH